ncbi:hypothetical protein [Salipaludibacillus sp. CF4.18]|uniref:hypothetical protein n=1 Tax=Salipaludibacillus sp. CF4.18 TaxID=3373081 RepID=UPI003EE492B7
MKTLKGVPQRLYLIYSFLILIYMINVFIDSPIITYIAGAITIPILIISFFGASKLFRILGSIFLAVGSYLFVESNLSLLHALTFFTTNLGLIGLLTVLPWMNIVVRAGRFDRRINELMKSNVSNMGSLYVRSTLTTYTLLSFINLSALTLTQSVLKENLQKVSKKFRDGFISQSTLRAFSMALVWSPMEILVAISVDATGVSYLTMLPWLVLFSVIMMTMESVRGKRAYATMKYEAPYQLTRSFSMKEIVLNILQLLFALTVFLTLIVGIGNLLDLSFIYAVTLVIFPFACAWAFLMKRWGSFLAIGVKTWKDRTNNMQNFFVLFVTLAFFSNSLNETPILQVIQQPFMAVSEYPLLILIFMQLTYLVMSMFGIHPIATIGVLIEVVAPLYSVMNPLSIGIVFITGALATASVATYGVTVTITSMNTQQNPYRITLTNMPFALLYGSVGTLLAYFLL